MIGIFNFSATADWNSTTLDRKQDANVFHQVSGFFVPIGKPRLPPWPLNLIDETHLISTSHKVLQNVCANTLCDSIIFLAVLRIPSLVASSRIRLPLCNPAIPFLAVSCLFPNFLHFKGVFPCNF